MSRSLEALIEAARDRDVPWDARRELDVERRIVARRERRVISAPFARVALGGLASVALCASVIQVSQFIRERGRAEERFEPEAPLHGGPLTAAEAWSAERPVGDGGFDGAGGS
jgi:hypothetical protein